ncbi:MAG: fumarate hydratase [Eubacteriales bacterium]
MRTIKYDDIKNSVKEIFLDANYNVDEEVFEELKKAYQREKNDTAKFVLDTIIKNDEIAKKEKMPLCQDTGMAIVFIEIGKDVSIDKGLLYDAINEGVREAYNEGFLRKSVVDDPLFERKNTKDNTPAVIHTELVSGDGLKITAAPKGFGSENMSRIKMLKPADGIEGIKKFILETVKDAGPNPCPPIILGVGIGGSFEKAALISKKALTRSIKISNENKKYAELENELVKEINGLDIGPGGFGGETTCLGVNIEYFPTHIASLPVAVNICCHAYRHKTIKL